MECYRRPVILIKIAILASIAVLISAILVAAIATLATEIAAIAAFAAALAATKIATATREATAAALWFNEVVYAIETTVTGSVRGRSFAAFQPNCLLEIHRDVELSGPVAEIAADDLIG